MPAGEGGGRRRERGMEGGKERTAGFNLQLILNSFLRRDKTICPILRHFQHTLHSALSTVIPVFVTHKTWRFAKTESWRADTKYSFCWVVHSRAYSAPYSFRVCVFFNPFCACQIAVDFSLNLGIDLSAKSGGFLAGNKKHGGRSEAF